MKSKLKVLSLSKNYFKSCEITVSKMQKLDVWFMIDNGEAYPHFGGAVRTVRRRLSKSFIKIVHKFLSVIENIRVVMALYIFRIIISNQWYIVTDQTSDQSTRPFIQKILMWKPTSTSNKTQWNISKEKETIYYILKTTYNVSHWTTIYIALCDSVTLGLVIYLLYILSYRERKRRQTILFRLYFS